MAIVRYDFGKISENCENFLNVCQLKNEAKPKLKTNVSFNFLALWMHTLDQNSLDYPYVSPQPISLLDYSVTTAAGDGQNSTNSTTSVSTPTTPIIGGNTPVPTRNTTGLLPSNRANNTE